jgi:hypothetical protein
VKASSGKISRQLAQQLRIHKTLADADVFNAYAVQHTHPTSLYALTTEDFL